MFSIIGDTFQGITSIAESAKKKRDARKFIAQAEARARNAEQQDFVNNAAQIKVDSRGTDRALENINLNAATAAQQASNAGIRGIGMIGKIQQNVNDAIAAESSRLAEKQFQVDQMAAQEAERQEFEQQRIFERQEDRTDAMLERGQALRSQAAAELGQGAAQVGGALGEGAEFLASAIPALATGGLSGAFQAGTAALRTAQGSGQEPGSQSDPGAVFRNMQGTTNIPSLANRPFNYLRFRGGN